MGKLRAHEPTLISVFLSFLIMGASVPALAATESDLLELVRTGMRHSYDSIKTFRGSVSYSNWSVENGKQVVSEGKITGAFDGCKSKVTLEQTSGPGSRSLEGAFDGANSTDWIKSGLGKKAHATIYPGKMGLGISTLRLFVDPRDFGLAYLKEGLDWHVVGRETLDGCDCVLVEATYTASSVTTQKDKLWVNTDKGFTVPRMERVTTETESGIVTQRQEYASEMKQYGDIWAPSKTTLLEYGKDGSKKWQKIITRGSDYEINVTINPSDLQLTLPSGLDVRDEVLDADYTIP